jgi:uncharacterized repeat protein (TIGR01451 family)
MIDVGDFTVAAAGRDSVVFEVRVDAPLAGGTRVLNQARVDAAELTDPLRSDGDPDTEGLQPTQIDVVARPVLTATKEAIVEGAERPAPGDVISYVIVVRNEGTVAAQEVVLTDVIPEFTQYVAGTMQVDGASRTDSGDDPDGADYDVTRAGAITVVLGTLEPGGVRTVSFQVRVDPALSESRSIVNRAEISAAGMAEVVLSNDPGGEGPTETPIEPSAVGARVEAIEPSANPVRGDAVTLRYRAAGGPATLSVWNLVGERVRVFGGLPPQGAVVWRVDNSAGRTVANGVYVVVLESPGEVRKQRLVVTR